MNAAEIWRLVREQRDEVGDLLETLREHEWETTSLCRGWQVRDVVAHCIQDHRATIWNFFGEWIASGFSLAARNERGVARLRSKDPALVLSEYRATAGRMNVPPWEAPGALVEAVVHGYDIARPLGRRIEVPAKSLVIVADACRNTPFLHTRRRGRGLTLRASDVRWSTGTGPEVSGPIASIILAMWGREATLDDLSGAGLTTLRSRL